MCNGNIESTPGSGSLHLALAASLLVGCGQEEEARDLGFSWSPWPAHRPTRGRRA